MVDYFISHFIDYMNIGAGFVLGVFTYRYMINKNISGNSISYIPMPKPLAKPKSLKKNVPKSFSDEELWKREQDKNDR